MLTSLFNAESSKFVEDDLTLCVFEFLMALFQNLSGLRNRRKSASRKTLLSASSGKVRAFLARYCFGNKNDFKLNAIH